jgi:hypothetical protein
MAAFTVVVTFALGYGYWKLATRQNEQDARIEQQSEEFRRSLVQLQRDADAKRSADNLEIQMFALMSPHLARLRESGREAATSQRIVAAAAELLSSRDRPGLAQLADKIRAQSISVAGSDSRATAVTAVAETSSSEPFLVLLATLPGDELKTAEGVANDKLRAAKDLGMMPAVGIYKTRLKGRYVVTLGSPVSRSAAVAVAAQARRRNLSADAYAERDDGWELTGTAPFPAEVRSASAH